MHFYEIQESDPPTLSHGFLKCRQTFELGDGDWDGKKVANPSFCEITASQLSVNNAKLNQRLKWLTQHNLHI